MLSGGSDDAMMRKELKFGIVLRVRVHGGDEHGSVAIQLAHQRQNVLGARYVQSAGGIYEINLRVDVEEDRFHAGPFRTASAAQGSGRRDIPGQYQKGCGRRWAIA